MGGSEERRGLSLRAWCIKLMLIVICLLSVAGAFGVWEDRDTVVSFTAGAPVRHPCGVWDLGVYGPAASGGPGSWEDLTALENEMVPEAREAAA